MIIKQLSVFLENKTGRINDVVHTLGANGINMHAFSMAEYLAEEQIFIEYMYAFAQADQAHVVIKPNDMSQCLKVLEAHHCHVLAKDEL